MGPALSEAQVQRRVEGYNGLAMFTAGQVIDGRYEIVSLLGEGGMGEVYRARRRLLGDEVAIKVVQSASRDTEALNALRDRFLRESRACAQLRHPHIVSILDFDLDTDERPYLVMELLNGPSLRRELAAIGTLDFAATAHIIQSVAGALQMAHDRGVVHRDLKPANLVAHRFDSGEKIYKVIDFGLANLRETTAAAEATRTRLTVGREFLGTVTYAPPEQLRGDDTDHRSDIYALGAVVFEMLTGHPPFDAPDPLVVATKHLQEGVPSIRGARRDVPEHVDEVVRRAMAKAPGDRYSSVSEFARALAGPDQSDAHDTGRLATVEPWGFLGKYELQQRLATGRLGSDIYAAKHRALDHPVAIRTLRRSASSNWDAARQRFLREARALQVTHPSVLQVRDYGEEGDVVYVVTELVESMSLRERLTREGPLSWPVLRTFARQIVGATIALRRKGGGICGLSPEIIRVTPDEEHGERALVSSAGICQVQDLLSTLSESSLRGTGPLDMEVPYVAPELLMGQPSDERSDVFTLGVLLYEMASSRLPFNAPTMPQLLGAMLMSPPKPLTEVRTDLPEAFAAAVMAAIAPQPFQRPETVAALRDRLGLA